MLCCQLLQAGIDWKFYNSIKAANQNSEPCVQVKDYRAGWLLTPCGVKQGDLMSPSLFTLYINELLTVVKEADVAVRVVI